MGHIICNLHIAMSLLKDIVLIEMKDDKKKLVIYLICSLADLTLKMLNDTNFFSKPK
jgi:hypothetical protein